jgi:hypothetical protein
VFVDQSGAEFSAIVEFSPHKKFPRKTHRIIGSNSVVNENEKVVLSKCETAGSFLTDPVYLKFLAKLEAEDLPGISG